MRAAVIDTVGSPGNLRLTEVAVPVPASREVLVRVRNVGINTIDWKTRAGNGVAIDAFPAVLGWDLAGEVVETGIDVSKFAPGAEVFGMIRFPRLGACYAEYVVAPVDELALRPMLLASRSAAAAPMAALTAWLALFSAGDSIAGAELFVHGSSGGVGHLAVQLGRWAGATVVGSASIESQAMLHGLGLGTIVSYDEIEARAGEADLIVDTRGGSDLHRLLAAARPDSTVASIAGRDEKAVAIADTRSVRLEFIYVHPDGATLSTIAPLLERGEVRPNIQASYPLQDVAAAHVVGETGHVKGKLVLDVETAS